MRQVPTLTSTERLDQISKLRVWTVLAGGGDVQNLAPERQHGLGSSILSLFGGATGTVALHNEDFGTFGC